MNNLAVPQWYSLVARYRWALGAGLMLLTSMAVGREGELYQPALSPNSLGDAAADSYQLTLLDSSRLSLPAVSVYDLQSSRSQSVDLAYQGQAVLSGGALTVSLPFEAPALPSFVRREIPSLWRVVIPAGQRVHPLPLRFEWEGLPGSAGDAAGSASLQPQLSAWVHSERRDELGRTVVEGGVWLDIPVLQLRHQQYRGRVVVLLEEY